ncbi:MAG: hypothetical protein LBJ00_12365 [Planctomycetaceae bacterium]|nr:hypothetical protein [Planctomycetaceae bacterium]
MNNRFTLLRLPNALRCRFTALKQLEYKGTKSTERFLSKSSSCFLLFL